MMNPNFLQQIDNQAIVKWSIPKIQRIFFVNHLNLSICSASNVQIQTDFGMWISDFGMMIRWENGFSGLGGYIRIFSLKQLL
jgi:hypothetical protein